jgi:RimJ/RimL family protein N-acetyltransferase
MMFQMSGGRELLLTLKANATANAPCLCVPVGFPVEAVLRPVATAAGKVNAYDVHVLTEWRNRFVNSFLTEFVATEARTEEWLTDVVGPDPTRILFMLDDALGATVGYLGLAFIDWEENTGEADAIVRGAEVAPGVMAKAMFTLLDWARGQLGLKSVSARVRSDNPALSFFLKFASETKRVPLRAVEEPGIIRLVEDETLVDAPVSLVYVTFKSQTLHEKPESRHDVRDFQDS